MARKAKVRRDSRQSGADYERGTERLKAWAALVTAFGSLGGLAVYVGIFTSGGTNKVTPPETGNTSAPVPAVTAPPGPQPPVAAPDQGGGEGTVEFKSRVTAPTGKSTVECEGSVTYCRQLLAAQLAVERLHRTAGANGSTASPPPSPVPPTPEPVPVPPEPVPVPPEPVPVPPEPTPEPPRSCVAGPFMIFFDWDRHEITPQAEAILDNAASAYQYCGQAHVMLAGHTDRSGPDGYNVRLSQRRTASARSYLAGRGIPEAVMTTEAFGESRPLVETPDGLNEPQNRRVEITFGPGSGW